MTLVKFGELYVDDNMTVSELFKRLQVESGAIQIKNVIRKSPMETKVSQTAQEILEECDE